MRPIVRSVEPDSFTMWKAQSSDDWQPTWENLQQPEKPALLNALLRDQGFVCCYCEQRVEASHKSSHIEHLQPRHLAPELAVEFTNLLASCQGEMPKAPAHCGHLKSDEPVEVHPLMPDCREYFVFDSAGGVRPVEDPAKGEAAQRTIETLGLGLPKLEAMRRAAIEGALEVLETGDDEELRALLAVLDARDANGRFTPFASAAVQVLARYSQP